MCRVAEKYKCLPFDPAFIEMWNNFDRRVLLVASLEIENKTDVIIKLISQTLPDLFIKIMDIVGTSLFNIWVKPKNRVKHLLKASHGRAGGKKMTLPDGRVINILKGE